MTHRTASSGFTAVELLITLFVAAAFLVAGYQLFNLVIKDGGDTRVEASAGNTAYDYLRRYSDSATNPCAPSTPLASSPVTIEGASSATISIAITCPQDDAPTLSKVEATVSYGVGVDAHTVKFATYVDKSRGATPNTDITNGLIEWWKLNGNTNSSAGSMTLINEGAPSGAGQDGNAVGAYSFTASDQKVLRADNFSEKMVGLDAFTITGWVYPQNNPTAHAGFFGFRDDAVGGVHALQMTGTNTLECRMRYSSTGYAQNSSLTLTPNTWQLISMVYNGSTFKCYIGTTGSVASSVSWSSFTATNIPFTIGRSITHYMTGRIDDVRVYNRDLSASEISQLVTGGAK
jgi:hypothetical protein